jgi:hypothetical protein
VAAWVASTAILLAAYVVLGRGLMKHQKLGKRIYRYAD